MGWGLLNTFPGKAFWLETDTSGTKVVVWFAGPVL